MNQILANRRWCYWLDHTKPAPDNKKVYKVSIVVEGVQGHYPTGGKIAWYWDEETCQAQNARRGISKEDALKIVLSSMFPKSHHLPQEAPNHENGPRVA